MKKIINFIKKSKYRMFLIIYALVLFVVLTVFLAGFSAYLSKYEKFKPEKVVTEFLSAMDNEYWNEMVSDRYNYKVTQFEDAEEIIDKLELNNIEVDKLTFHKRIKEYTDKAPAYTVYYKNKEFAAIKLKPEEKYSFGLTKWSIGSVVLSLNDDEVNSVCVQITVPPEVFVKVNGIRLGDSSVSDSRVVYEDVTEFEKQKEGVPYRVKYTVNGLFDLPEVKAYDESGQEIEMSVRGYDYSVAVHHSDKKNITVTVPKGYSVALNGIQVSNEYISNNDIKYSLIDGVKGYNADVPLLDEYKIEGLYTEPDIKVTDQSGKEIPVSKTQNSSFSYGFGGDEGVKNNFKPVVEKFIFAYFKYTADGNRNIGTNYSNLLSYVLSGSDAYTVIQGSYNGVIWNDTHNIKYNKLEYKNFVMHGNDCFTCEVEYDADFTLYVYNTHYEGTFRMVYVRQGDTFKLSRLISE